MYRRAIALRPSYWFNYNAQGSFFFRRARLEEAKEMFRKVIELRPESDTGYANLAAVHIMAGEFGQAEPLLQKALRVNPTYVTYNNLGLVYYAMGRFAEAAEQWQKATESGVQHPMLFSNLGDAYRHRGDADKAQEAYRRAVEIGESVLEIDATDDEARAGVATALAGLGRCEEAGSEARRSVADSHGNPAISYYAAITLMICGERVHAIEQTLQAIDGGFVVDVKTNPDLRPLLEDPMVETRLAAAD
jgi:tetratricopeptide (TPR) repeat protein